jgi:hypothetical protein
LSVSANDRLPAPKRSQTESVCLTLLQSFRLADGGQCGVRQRGIADEKASQTGTGLRPTAVAMTSKNPADFSTGFFYGCGGEPGDQPGERFELVTFRL